jgi:hypothetical protein
MTSVKPTGEDIRQAVRWISEERQADPAKNVARLIEEACVKFDLSPMDAEFLARTIGRQS